MECYYYESLEENFPEKSGGNLMKYLKIKNLPQLLTVLK